MKNLRTVLCLVVVAVLSFVATLNVKAEDSITVKVIKDSKEFGYKVAAGQSLNEIKEQGYASELKAVIDDADHSDYLTFIDVATGKAVDLNEKLYKDITIKAIEDDATITIKVVNGNSFSGINAGITINQFKELDYASQVKNLINDTTKEFAMFINDATGEEIGLDEPIYADTAIRAIYYINVTVDGTDYEVLETAKLADLVQYAAKKDGYEFVAFTDEDGNAVTDESVVNGAKFVSTYKEIPVEPTTEATPAPVSNEAAPATISNPQTADRVITYVVMSMISIAGVSLAGYAISKKVRKA